MTIDVPEEFRAERTRQIAVEGYSAAHDDEHDSGEMVVVATLYWQRAIGVALPMRAADEGCGPVSVPLGFPWDAQWWKPKSARRDLERAGALCLAEIERLTRCGRPTRPVDEKLDLIASAYRALP